MRYLHSTIKFVIRDSHFDLYYLYSSTTYAVRGLDINTSYTIYNLLDEEKKEGVAVVYVGEDLDVLIDLCDRILVLCGGKENGILDARTTTKEEVGLLMTNLRKEGK